MTHQAARTASHALTSFNDDDVYVYRAATRELVRTISCKDSQVRDSRYIGLRVDAGESWAKGMEAKSLGLWTAPACDGSCEEHVGVIRRVHVEKWGEFNYCEEAIAEDERRGLVVRIIEPAGFGPSPADRFVATSIAAIRKPLEMTHG